MPTLAQNRIYRKKMCPWGQKVAKLLDDHGISYHDHLFDSKDEEMAFKKELAVNSTPQIFLDGRHIGGYRELQQYLSEPVPHANQPSYFSLIWVLILSLGLALVTQLNLKGFLGFSLTLLASLKIMGLANFSDRFKQYDLFSQKIPQYAYVFPFVQLALGWALLAGYFLMPLSIIALVTGLSGFIGVIKSLYIDKKNLNCSSIGGYYPMPQSILSLVEYIILLLIGIIFLL